MELDKQSLEILRCFVNQKEPLDIAQLIIFTPYKSEDINECVAHLLACKFIKMVGHQSSSVKKFKPTRKGKITLENESKYRQYRAFNEFRAWVTLLIAVIALILSIVK